MSNPVMNRTLESIERGPSGVEIPQVTTERLTVAGTMNRTISLFSVLLVAAVAAWIFQPMVLLFPAMLVGLGLALFASFSRKVRPAVMVGYAAAEGVFLALLSVLFESAYPGIAMQAVTATVTTAGLMFVAYQQRWIKVTNRFRAMMSFAILGYLGFAVVNLIFGMVTNSSGAYGTSVGWLIALAGVGLAAFTLVIDFADIESAAQLNVPAEYEWRFAFSLMVSLVWMYTEILRLLAILRGRD